MATQQLQLVCDNSTLTNFKAWAQAISSWFGTCGWTQTADTGQVNWSTIASVPGSGAYVYEIWQPGDALTTFKVKIEYGNVSGTNAPSIKISLSTTTNGSGSVSGLSFGPMFVNATAFTPPSTSTQYECNFSGDSGRMAVMMWRNAPSNQGQSLFCIERSLDSSGTYTSTYVTLWVQGFNTNNRGAQQKSLIFGVGAGPGTVVQDGGNAGWNVRNIQPSTSFAFNGSIPIDFPAPMVGYHDYPCTSCGIGAGIDIVEGVTFTATLYGTLHTFMPGKIGPFAFTRNNLDNGGTGVTGYATLMRYD